jgi:hypothetical protein
MKCTTINFCPASKYLAKLHEKLLIVTLRLAPCFTVKESQHAPRQHRRKTFNQGRILVLDSAEKWCIIMTPPEVTKKNSPHLHGLTRNVERNIFTVDDTVHETQPVGQHFGRCFNKHLHKTVTGIDQERLILLSLRFANPSDNANHKSTLREYRSTPGLIRPMPYFSSWDWPTKRSAFNAIGASELKCKR